mmetsp:Transcript_90758/g.292951  ORF Transcript_90758/g.292951 Transcript_90758/m.292951 type:complete len:205 (-) Transcript_90758:1921-2535(-)
MPAQEWEKSLACSPAVSRRPPSSDIGTARERCSPAGCCSAAGRSSARCRPTTWSSCARARTASNAPPSLERHRTLPRAAGGRACRYSSARPGAFGSWARCQLPFPKRLLLQARRQSSLQVCRNWLMPLLRNYASGSRLLWRRMPLRWNRARQRGAPRRPESNRCRRGRSRGPGWNAPPSSLLRCGSCASPLGLTVWLRSALVPC